MSFRKLLEAAVSNKPVAGPISTGAGGPMFEQHVDAFFLAILLVRGIPPMLLDCQMEALHLQAAHLGWHTDDLVIVGSGSALGRRHVALQVKLGFTVGAADFECRRAVTALWKDFSGKVFDGERDRLAILTQRAAERLHQTLAGVLAMARASTDHRQFAHRVGAYSSREAKRQLTALRDIITESEGGHAPDEEHFWRFLRATHVVQLDLNTSASQSEAFIQTLLAQSVTGPDQDQPAVARATWNALLALVSSGMPSATSYTYDNLPADLRGRHAATVALAPLKNLQEHSELTLSGIRTTLKGGVTISRDAAVASLLESLHTSRVVVVTGSAGSGKSAIAKQALAGLEKDVCCLAFRAEEFAAPHLDQALQSMHIAASGASLLALLAAQGEKVILIDSVERLLESSVRDAFADLLRLVRDDANVCVVLTCRDFATETVRASLLTQNSVAHYVERVPALDDDELQQAEKADPRLATPLGNSRLKNILRLPYMLDIAARLDWSTAVRLPETEREFRRLCWSEVIQRDAVRADGLHIKRGRAFLDLALRRARSLTPLVKCSDLDAQALSALQSDNLVVVADASGLASPAHDVLEDWAVTEWLAERFVEHQAQPGPLAEDISGYPAIRRGYRKWLGEMFEAESTTADAFLLSVLNGDKIPVFFQDDTLVALLLSSAGEPFLMRQRQALLANDGALFIRVIHLLRVACKEPLSAFESIPTLSAQMLVPKGEAWPAILTIVSEALPAFIPQKMGLILGLLEDWAKQVSWAQSAPPGFQQSGTIAFALLSHASGYSHDELQKRLFAVLAKIPRANPTAFEDLLTRAETGGRGDRAAWVFGDFLLSGLESACACRDFPREVAALVMTRCCWTAAELKGRSPMYYSPGIEHYFGIHDHLEFFPPSALRGPFSSLLRSHPHIGVELVLNLLNHVGQWYGEQLWPEDHLEPAWRISLTVPDAEAVEQWCNQRLWCMYRSTSVAPCVVEAALMALEQWLLEMGDVADFDLEGWLLYLLSKSNSVGVTAVVASVSTAHPTKCGRAGIAVLSSRDLFGLDRGRMVHDRSGDILDNLPARDFETEMFQEERKRSRALPHRMKDLEALALDMQLGDQRQMVWDVLDRHRAALPPVAEQAEDDRLWRLSLHRMDIRRYREVEAPPEAQTDQADGAPRRQFYAPGPVDEDVQALLDQDAPLRKQQQADMTLFHWGLAVWQRNQSAAAAPETWRERLQEATERHQQAHTIENFLRGGPAFVAAVCARDHWDELSPDEQRWSAQTMIEAIEEHLTSAEHFVRVARNSLSPDRAAAYIMPYILTRADDADLERAARSALAEALLHPVGEVAGYAAEGCGHYLQGSWQGLAVECAGVLAKRGRLVSQHWKTEHRKRYDQRRTPEQISTALVPALRAELLVGTVDGELELRTVGLRDWAGRDAARRIFGIIANAMDLEPAHSFHRRALETIAKEWDVDQRQRRTSDRRDFVFEGESLNRVARFVLKLSAANARAVVEPLLGCVNEHPSEVARFVSDLILEEDGATAPTPFWELWESFAERVASAPWLSRIDSTHAHGADLLQAIFLNTYWKRDVRHWRRIEGEGGRIEALVRRLPVSAAVLAAYARFLYEVGEQSLPEAFETVQDRLKKGDVSVLLAQQGTIYCLTELLGRYVYGHPLTLKKASSMRTAVIGILDALVAGGSSAAFRMRDDFVTPIGAV